MRIIDQPIETNNPTVNLGLLLDLLDVLESEIAQLPAPAPLFASELRTTITEVLGVAGNSD